jgi:hypothetical protein
MKSYSKQWKDASLNEKVEIICIALGASAALIGAATGVWALREYKTTNELTMAGQLQTVDREIAMLTFNYPVLHALWVSVPDNLHGKDRADAFLSAYLSNTNEKTKILGSTWKTVKDLELILWSHGNIHSADMQILRNGSTYVESILYLVCSAIDAEQSGRLRAEDAKTYVAYLCDVGAHPLFLHVLWYGHKGGYFSPKVAQRLQNELLKNNETRKMAESIYAELLDKNWPQKVGNSN